MTWVLASEDEEVGVALEFLIELRNVNGSSVVKDGIQALEDALLGQVHFINQEPVALLDCLE